KCHYKDRYIRNIKEIRNEKMESLEGFRKSIDGYRMAKKYNMTDWNEKQAYIVLANMMFAAALEEIDSCPMEGFKPGKIEEILELDTEAERISVTLALGYRAEDDAFQHNKKVRKTDEKLFKFL